MESETLDDTVFISDHVDRTYEHFIQITPTIYRSTRGLTVKTYKYSVTSAEHTDSDTFPSAKFSYQISPMAIVMTEKCELQKRTKTSTCSPAVRSAAQPPGSLDQIGSGLTPSLLRACVCPCVFAVHYLCAVSSDAAL